MSSPTVTRKDITAHERPFRSGAVLEAFVQIGRNVADLDHHHDSILEHVAHM